MSKAIKTASILISKSSDSESSDSLSTLSSSPPDPEPANKIRKLAHGDEDIPHIQEPRKLPYVRLNEDYEHSKRWSNHPADLRLETYFNAEEPNLETDFNIKGLRPILRENVGFYRFILTDDKNRMYVWDEDGYLFWVKDEELETIESVEDRVEFVLCGLGCLEVEPVSPYYHPAEDAEDLKAIREKVSKFRI